MRVSLQQLIIFSYKEHNPNLFSYLANPWINTSRAAISLFYKKEITRVQRSPERHPVNEQRGIFSPGLRNSLSRLLF